MESPAQNVVSVPRFGTGSGLTVNTIESTLAQPEPFVTSTKLREHKNIHVVLNQDDEFYNTFYLNHVPSTVVYDAKHQFIGHYEGAVKAEALITTLTGAVDIYYDGEYIGKKYLHDQQD